MLRKNLDKLYEACGAVAALLIACICMLVCAQVIFNLITKFGGGDVNFTIPSYADFAGYMLSASSFLALAYTLRKGGHIRVNLVLSRLPYSFRFAAEVVSLLVCFVLSVFACFYIAMLCLESLEFGDLSPGIVAIPLWIPQTSMLLGMIVLTIALFDSLLCTLRTGQSPFVALETEGYGAE